MLTLVYGGACSGKSALAEQIICRSKASVRIYLATMQPFGEDAKARIARHRTFRAQKGFETVEQYTNLNAVSVGQDHAVLLECLPNLLANELFDAAGAKENAESAILQGISHLLAQSRDLVIVSGDLFSDGVHYPLQTQQYLQLLGTLNRALAQQADCVIETVCGIAVVHKGVLE